MKPTEVGMVAVAELNRAEYNPRAELRAGDPEYESLKASIEAFGQGIPLVVNKRGNVIVGGHQRLSVMTELGFENVWVSWVDLDKDDEKRLNLALNKIDVGFDPARLGATLATIRPELLPLTGFLRVPGKSAEEEMWGEAKKAKGLDTAGGTCGWKGCIAVLTVEEAEDTVEALSLRAGEDGVETSKALFTILRSICDDSV